MFVCGKFAALIAGASSLIVKVDIKVIDGASNII